MARSRVGLKVLGLCALVLGLMAFVASAAQAEALSHWNILKATGELVQIPGINDLLPQLEIKEIENKTGQLEFTTAGGTLVKILCTEAKFDEGGVLVREGGISLGRISFTGCKVELNSKPAAGCEAHSTGQPVGTILTEKATGLIVLDVVGGITQDYVKFTPDVGTTLAKIEMGEECVFGTLVKVDGFFWAKDCVSNTSFLEEKVEHLVAESLHGLLALGQPAVIEGSALVKLAGAHVGQKWGGTPG